MLDDLPIGSRVCVTGRYGEIAYPLGEKGTVLDGPRTSSVSGALNYVAAMDKNVAGSRTVFLVDEIEAAVKEQEGQV